LLKGGAVAIVVTSKGLPGPDGSVIEPQTAFRFEMTYQGDWKAFFKGQRDGKWVVHIPTTQTGPYDERPTSVAQSQWLETLRIGPRGRKLKDIWYGRWETAGLQDVEGALGPLRTSPNVDRQMLEMFGQHRSMYTSLKDMNAYLDERLETDPDNPDVHACRAQIVSDRFKHTETLKIVQPALLAHPHHERLLWLASYAHLCLSNWVEGEAVCALYRSLYPDTEHTLSRHAWFLAELQQYDEAIALMEQLMATFDDRVRPGRLKRIGEYHQRAERYDEALAVYERALTSCTPDDDYTKTEILFEKGWIHLHIREASLEALNALVQVNRAFMTHPKLHYHKGLAYRGLDCWVEALAVFELAQREGFRGDELLFYKGLTHFELAQFEEAVGALTEYLTHHPAWANALYWRGQAKASLGDEAGALADWKEAARLAHPDAAQKLADLADD